MAKIYGPDVSSYQGHVDWKAVRKGGAVFGVAKATEGPNYINPYFKESWVGMKKAGLIRGAYHYATLKYTPEAEADHFLSVVGPIEAGDFLALDVETNGGQRPAQVASWVKRFCDRVAAKTKLPKSRIVVYTGAWFWDSKTGAAGSRIVADHTVWLSGYTPDKPPMTKGWDRYSFWQYTNHATGPGIAGPHDESEWEGTLAQLRTLVGLVTVPAKPKPPAVKPPVTPKPPVVTPKPPVVTPPAHPGHAALHILARPFDKTKVWHVGYDALGTTEQSQLHHLQYHLHLPLTDVYDQKTSDAVKVKQKASKLRLLGPANGNLNFWCYRKITGQW